MSNIVAPIAYYKLDADVNDYGLSGYHGTNNGVTFVSGQVNNAGSFDGVGDYIQIPIGGLSVSAGSLCIWIKSDGIPSANANAFTHYNSGHNLVIRRDVTTGVLTIIIGDTTVYSSDDISDGNWHHIIVTWNGTTANIYVDKVLVGSAVPYSNFSSLTTVMYIGAFSTPSNYWNGNIDEVRIYDYVLSLFEVKRIYAFTGLDELVINGVDYSINFSDWFLDEASVFNASMLETDFYDADNYIRDNVERFQEIKLYYSGTLEFTGLVIDIKESQNNTKFVYLLCYDYWYIFLRSRVTANYTTETWSQILTDIVNNNIYVNQWNLGASKITATTNVPVKRFLGKPGYEVAISASKSEGFATYVDEDKDLVFKPLISTDTGVHLVYANGDIQLESFIRTGGEIISEAIVRGRPGAPGRAPVVVIVENDELKGYGMLVEEFNQPQLNTEAEAQEWGEQEIERRNNSPIRGEIVTSLNLTLTRGALVTITIAHRSITAQAFYIINARHHKRSNRTELDLVSYSKDGIDFINNIVRDAIKTSQYLSDGAAVATRIKKLTEPIMVTVTVDVDSRTYSGAIYGEFYYSSKYYGQISGVWTSVISGQSMKLTNQGIEDMLRLIGQIATVPNLFDSANASIAVGTGTTAVQYSDTSLENQTYDIAVEPGTPLINSSNQLEYQMIIGDSDVELASFSNVGIFADNMIAAVVLSSAVSKVADQEIRFTIKISLTITSYLTSTGLVLLLQLISGLNSNFLDNSNSAIEVTTNVPNTYREAVFTGFPKFADASLNKVIWQTNIDAADVVAQSLGGQNFVEMDLYNKTSGGTKVVDGTVGKAFFNDLESVYAQILLELTR